MLSFMLIVLLPGATLGGTDLAFPRVGSTYRIQYSEISVIRSMPEMVTVLGRGSRGWYLVEYKSSTQGSTNPVLKTWLNFDLILSADEEMLEALEEEVGNTKNSIDEKPTGIYP